MDDELATRIKEIDDTFALLLRYNRPSVLPEGGFERLREIAALSYESYDGPRPYLTPEEVIALSIPKGSLTQEERREIESHVSHTYQYLSKIPWTAALQNVPSIAYSHHEKLDGTGYPRKVTAAMIPVQARMMTIADIYDALTASDRPYKAAVPPQKALEILDEQARQGKIDGHLFTLFVEAEVYRLLPAVH